MKPQRLEAVIRMEKGWRPSEDVGNFVTLLEFGECLGECPDWGPIEKAIVAGKTYHVTVTLKEWKSKENPNGNRQS